MWCLYFDLCHYVMDNKAIIIELDANKHVGNMECAVNLLQKSNLSNFTTTIT